MNSASHNSKIAHFTMHVSACYHAKSKQCFFKRVVKFSSWKY